MSTIIAAHSTSVVGGALFILEWELAFLPIDGPAHGALILAVVP